MIGPRIRELRTSRRMSLSEVAEKASISTATLSRIETGKQSIDVGLMTMIARVMHFSPHDLLDADDEGGEGHLADKIATLKGPDRTRFWKDLSGSRSRNGSSPRYEDIGQEVEELLAQIDFLRGEVDRIRQVLGTRRTPRRPVAK